MAMSHTGDMHGHHVPPSNNTVLGAVRSVVTFLNATRDAMQARDPHHFRACITTQVGMLKNTIRRLNPDHADAANATIELRTSACFNDDERNELIDAALDLAERIARNGPLAVRAILATHRGSDGLSLADALALSGKLGGPIFQTEDAAEGTRAFVEKRTPSYHGR